MSTQCPKPYLPNQLAPLVHTDILLAFCPLDADPAAERICLHDELGYGERKNKRCLLGLPAQGCAKVSLSSQTKGVVNCRACSTKRFSIIPQDPLTQELGRNSEARLGRLQVVWGKGQVLPNLLPSSAVAEMRRPVTCTCLPLVRL